MVISTSQLQDLPSSPPSSSVSLDTTTPKVSTLNLKLIFLATYVNQTTVICWVPAFESPQVVLFSLLTTDNFKIESRNFTFSFDNDVMIKSIYPEVGNMSGGIPFTLYGDFSALIGGSFKLLWNDTQIVDAACSISGKQIMGIIPASTTIGRVDIRI